MTLSEIEREVSRLAASIGAPPNALPTYGSSEHSGRPHIEIDARGLHWVVCERGSEFERLTFDSTEDLLERVFESVTFEMACAYEVAHRTREDVDCRRVLFAKQVELLGQLSPAWADAERQSHAEILTRHPFDDLASLRARRSRELRESGLSNDLAWAQACDDFPPLS